MIDINKTKDILCKRLDIAFDGVVRVENLVNTAQNKLMALDIKIDKKETVIVQLDILEEQMGNLRKNYKNLQKEIDVKNKQYQSTIKNSEQIIKDQDKQYKQLKSKHNLLIVNNKKELSKVIPTIEDLTVREKIVKQKEQDISVVERRYKKLFKVYGANFTL